MKFEEISIPVVEAEEMVVEEWVMDAKWKGLAP